MIWRKLSMLALILTISLFSTTPLLAYKLKVTTEKDPYAVFYPAKTYGWHPLSATYYNFDEPIRAAVDRELAAKGFKKITRGSPDFWIAYQFHRTEGTKEVMKGSGRGDYTWDEKKYREGTLAVHVFTPDRRHIIFKGWSESVYDPQLSDEEKVKMSDEAIKKIVAQLPPPG